MSLKLASYRIAYLHIFDVEFILRPADAADDDHDGQVAGEDNLREVKAVSEVRADSWASRCRPEQCSLEQVDPSLHIY